MRALRRRDGNLCFYCGTEPNRASHHVDHVTPKSRGGSDHIDNLVFACRDCNLTKSTWSGWFFVIRGWSLGRWEVAA